jgi:nitrite reductase (NADH) large subunit
MWGGVTNRRRAARHRRRGRQVQIPTVKVTGGQRIDMLGVKKEDLPAVWADLNAAGMVSGHAYAKGLRTVKTCVGTDWCRFGTQDSTGLGVRIEKFMWGSWTPAKVKMAVSGCPRNCAEATCKDVGVICVDSGYEIHFAGAAGLDIKGTEVLWAKVEDRGRGARDHRGARPALSRAGPLSRAHLQMGEARRHDEIRRRSSTTPTSAARYYERFVFPRSSRRSIPGPSASPARTHEFAALASSAVPEAAE